MIAFVFIAGVVINILVSYTAYSKSEPNLTSLSGSILLFGCLTFALIFTLWPRGKRPKNYWYPGQGMGYLSKMQVTLFFAWFLIGGATTILLWLYNL